MRGLRGDSFFKSFPLIFFFIPQISNGAADPGATYAEKVQETQIEMRDVSTSLDMTIGRTRRIIASWSKWTSNTPAICTAMLRTGHRNRKFLRMRRLTTKAKAKRFHQPI